jgi:hypothetical protein
MLVKDAGEQATAKAGPELADPQQTQQNAPKWKLQILADEELRFTSLKNLKVGHAWVRLLDPHQQVQSWGFWPKTPISLKWYAPWKVADSVPGMVRHPDDTHSPNAVHTYDIDQAAAEKMQNSAAERVASPGSYNLFHRNCVNFAIDMCRAAGVSAPSFSTLTIANPNALHDGIEKMNAKKGEDAMEHKLPPPKVVTGDAPQGA